MNNFGSTVSDSVETLLDTIAKGVPKFVGALLILIVAYIVAKVLSKVVSKALQAAGLDDQLHKHDLGGQYLQRVMPSPSKFLGAVVFWLLFLFGISITISTLGIPALNALVLGIYAYVPRIVAALLIFVVAGVVSAAISGVVTKLMGDTTTGKIVATVAPVVILGIAVFMMLDQLKIAPTIVTITYAAMMGSVFLGLALAFGLGGRDVAAQILQKSYEAAKAQQPQVKNDFQTATIRGTAQAAKLKNKMR